MLEGAHFLVLPEGIETSSGPRVEATCKVLGIEFDEWQSDFCTALHGKLEDGKYAADMVMMSIPRQVGKTFLMMAIVFADCIINPGSLTVWTAHHFKVCREVFRAMKSLAESDPMKPYVDCESGIKTAAGNEQIEFKNGSRILFMARENNALRGFSKISRLILDEGQILSERAMSDIVPTMNTSDNPQAILMGTPPKPTDPAEVFSKMRSEAHDGSSTGALYVEFSADRTCDLDDREAWAQANPSVPNRTPYRAIVRMRKAFASEDDFAREALGIWDGLEAHRVIEAEQWDRCISQTPVGESPVAIALDVSPNRDQASMAVAGWDLEDHPYVDVIETRRGDPKWGVAKFVAFSERFNVRAVVIDGAGAGNALVEPLRQAGLTVTVTTARQMAIAFGGFYDAVLDERLRHLNQAPLNYALSVARKRRIGDGGHGWSRRDSESDITPVVAATLALWGLTSDDIELPPKKRTGRAVFV